MDFRAGLGEPPGVVDQDVEVAKLARRAIVPGAEDDGELLVLQPRVDADRFEIFLDGQLDQLQVGVAGVAVHHQAQRRPVFDALDAVRLADTVAVLVPPAHFVEELLGALGIVDERLDLQAIQPTANGESISKTRPSNSSWLIRSRFTAKVIASRTRRSPRIGCGGVRARVVVEGFGEVEPHAHDPDTGGDATHPGAGGLDLLLGLIARPRA